MNVVIIENQTPEDRLTEIKNELKHEVKDEIAEDKINENQSLNVGFEQKSLEQMIEEVEEDCQMIEEVEEDCQLVAVGSKKPFKNPCLKMCNFWS